MRRRQRLPISLAECTVWARQSLRAGPAAPSCSCLEVKTLHIVRKPRRSPSEEPRIAYRILCWVVCGQLIVLESVMACHCLIGRKPTSRSAHNCQLVLQYLINDPPLHGRRERGRHFVLPRRSTPNLRLESATPICVSSPPVLLVPARTQRSVSVKTPGEMLNPGSVQVQTTSLEDKELFQSIVR